LRVSKKREPSGHCQPFPIGDVEDLVKKRRKGLFEKSAKREWRGGGSSGTKKAKHPIQEESRYEEETKGLKNAKRRNGSGRGPTPKVERGRLWH